MEQSNVLFTYGTLIEQSYVRVNEMLNKNTLGVKKVRGQSEATMII